MRILFITNICSHYRRPVYELLAKHHSVKFVFYSDGGEYYFDKKNGMMFGSLDGEYLKGFYLFPKIRVTPKLLWYLLFTHYDCILLGMVGRFSIMASFLLGKYIRRKPIIGWLGMWTHPHSFFHRWTFPVTQFVYKRLDSILVYGTHSKKYLVDIGVQADKIFYAWNSVDNSLFDRTVEHHEIQHWRKDLQLGNEKIVLYVGRFTPIKGLRYLFEAISLINKCYANFVLVLIGDGEQEPLMRAQVKRLNLQNIIFHTYIPNDQLCVAYASASLFVLPSITYNGNKETWGLVCNEAMNQGCPVVATDSVGAAMGGLILHEENGLVVPEKDAQALADALVKILGDDEFREKLSTNCKKKIKTWNPEFQYSGIEEALHYVVHSQAAR